MQSPPYDPAVFVPSHDKTRPIKILRIIDRLNIGGPAIHTLLLTRLMNSAPTSPSLWHTSLLYGQEGPYEGNMLPMAGDADVHLHYVPSLGRELNPLRDWISLWDVIRWIRKLRPDVVHTHKSKAGVIGRLAARLCNVPVIVHTYHGHVLHGYFSLLKNRLFIAIERFMARFTDKLIAVSPKVRDDLIRCQIAPPEKFLVMYLGLDLTKFAQKARNTGTLRKDLGLTDKTPVVGIVARLVPIKRINLFLDMAEVLHERSPDVHFVVVGDGELRSSLEAKAATLKVNPKVHFVGFRTDVENIYPDLDVLTLTSANEGSPVSLIEGMASGSPVVATAVGGVPDVVQDGVTGLLAKTSDAKELAGLIETLLCDPELRQNYGAAGKKHALRHFHIDRLVADLAVLYRSQLKEKFYNTVKF